MRCIICGKNAKNETVCDACLVKNYTGVVSFNSFDLKICCMCDAYMYAKSWHPPLKLEQAVRKAFYDSTKFHRKPKEYSVKITLPKHERKIGNKVIGKVVITIKTTLGNSLKEESHEYPLRMRYTRCDTCSRNMGGYFQGVLQLRNDKSKQFHAAVSFIKKKVAEKKGVEITKEDPVKNGIDFYITSKAYLNTLGKIVSQQFGGELKTTAELFSQDKQTSKELYRTSVLVRLPEFNIGDVLDINNRYVFVKAIRDKSIEGIDLKTNKPAKEQFIDKDYDVITTSDDVVEVPVVRIKPQLEILDPKTYQPVIVENKLDLKEFKHKKQEKNQENVSAVCIEGRWYVVG